MRWLFYPTLHSSVPVRHRDSLSHAGGLATGLAALSKSAAIAASASGIGAVVTVGAVVVTAFQHMGDAAKATQAQIDHLNTFTAQTMPGQSRR
jgi:hypothetical protein